MSPNFARAVFALIAAFFAAFFCGRFSRFSDADSSMPMGADLLNH
jgi:hypothetical protein